MSRAIHRLLIVSLALLLLFLAQQPSRAAVTLIEFKAETVASAINHITWRTGSEIGTNAFRLWRGQSASGPWQMLTTVAAEGDSISGASYSYDDDNLPAPSQVWYILQELANQGDSCFGPISPGQGSSVDATTCPSDATATNTPTVTRTATPPPSATPTPTTRPSSTPTPAPTHTPTPTVLATNTPTAQATALTPSPTAVISPTPSRTPSPSPTFISVILVTSTPSATPGATPSAATTEVTATATVTAFTPTPSPTEPATATPSPTTGAEPTEMPTPALNPTPTPGFIILPSPTPFPARPASPLPAIFLLVGLGSLGGAAALGFIAWRNGLLPNSRQKPPGDGK